jgi:peptide/nickel transport system permease protein
MNILPGDVAMVMLLQEGGTVDPQEYAHLVKQLGLDKPVLQQYWNWLSGFLTGDLGVSMWTSRPVIDEILHRLPYTGSLVVLAVFVSFITAVPIGVISAVYQDSWLDYGLRIFVIAGIAIPNFVLGLMIILVLVVGFRWFMPLDYATLWTDPWVAIQQLFWPALVLGFRAACGQARMMRSSMLEIMRADYVRTARSKGLSERVVIYVHALRNAILPVITMFGLEVAFLFGGSVIIETVFNIPGIGLLMIDAIDRRDVILVQGVTAMMVSVVIVVNLVTDLIYAWIDPRIRYS